MIVKEKGETCEHHHFYYDQKGKHHSHKKDEKTGKKIQTNTNICDLRVDIIKKEGYQPNHP